MPHLSGLFEKFTQILEISATNVNRHLKVKIELHQLENIIASKVLYPQAVPVSKSDLEIELAIFREVWRINPDIFLSQDKLIIPEFYLTRFPNHEQFIKAVIESHKLSEITNIIVKRDRNASIEGTVIKIVLPKNSQILINGKSLRLNKNQLNFFKGKERNLMVEIPGQHIRKGVAGIFGIILDTRENG